MNDEKRGIEEAYTSAMTSSNLRVEADRPSDADVIIAAGWNQSRIGGALLRLHTEWDASEKPRMASFEHFLPSLKTGTPKERKVRAHAMAHQHNLHEMGILLGKLKALPDVRREATMQAMKWGMGQSMDPITRSERSEVRAHDAQMLKRLREAVANAGPECLDDRNAELVSATEEVNARRRAEEAEDREHCSEKAIAVIRWWLSQSCPVCQGTKFQVVEGTHRHNGKACGKCHGTGCSEIPHDQEGRRLAGWFDQCVERARASIGRRLRPGRMEA
ncbi:hypothetical protein J7E62_27630 [Variovorax paradoxus]|nr:hypothetical protein [Variovorax paradoxus]